jgi:hypothetical protein
MLRFANVNCRFYGHKLSLPSDVVQGKQIFATVRPGSTSGKLEIQYSYLHSNEILNIKCILSYP